MSGQQEELSATPPPATHRCYNIDRGGEQMSRPQTYEILMVINLLLSITQGEEGSIPWSLFLSPPSHHQTPPPPSPPPAPALSCSSSYSSSALHLIVVLFLLFPSLPPLPPPPPPPPLLSPLCYKEYNITPLVHLVDKGIQLVNKEYSTTVSMLPWRCA